MIQKVRIFLNRIAPRHFSCGLKFEDRVINDLMDLQKESQQKKLKGLKPFKVHGKVFWALNQENAEHKYKQKYGNVIDIQNAN